MVGDRAASSLDAGFRRSHLEQKIMDRPYNILLADDHVGFRREVKKILEEIPGVKVTGEAGNAANCSNGCGNHRRNW